MHLIIQTYGTLSDCENECEQDTAGLDRTGSKAAQSAKAPRRRGHQDTGRTLTSAIDTRPAVCAHVCE